MTQATVVSEAVLETSADGRRQQGRCVRQGSDEVEALEKMVREHQGSVERTVRRLMGWAGDCEDVVQEVFLAAIRHRSGFRGESAVRTWLTAIAIRRCRTERRKWWKRWRAGREVEAVTNGEESGDEVGEVVRDAVRKLPQGEREVVVLYYLQEMSAGEVAKVIGVKENAVNVRLCRARKRLGEMLKGVVEE